MHITDTLDAGGLEHVAVNLANLLPRERYRSYLCTTRRDGALADLVAEDVGRLRLMRRGRFDVAAIARLTHFIRQHDIRIVHAHGTALFLASCARLCPPYPKLVWHDHFGRYAVEERPAWFYRLFTRRVAAVVAVNEPLLHWSRECLRVPADRLAYVRNFVCTPRPAEPAEDLPGKAGRRLVCVANMRRQKDHPTLLRAMALVVKRIPDAHLLLVGTSVDAAYESEVYQLIRDLALNDHVSLLGQRDDVAAVLQACDIGLLSSASEGLPLALLEYGSAGLPSVATRTGQCPEVLDEGQAGLLVTPSNPQELSEAIIALLQSPEWRCRLGKRLSERVAEHYSTSAAMEQITCMYDKILST